MSASRFVIRVEDRSAAVERVLGRLRALLRGTPRVSLGEEEEGVLQLVVTLEAEAASREQLRSELLELRDVRSVDEFPPGPAACGHEMALIRLRPDPRAAEAGGDETPGEPGGERRPDARDDDRLVVLTGMGGEVDRILASLRESGLLAAAARTGALAPPPRAGPESGS